MNKQQIGTAQRELLQSLLREPCLKVDMSRNQKALLHGLIYLGLIRSWRGEWDMFGYQITDKGRAALETTK